MPFTKRFTWGQMMRVQPGKVNIFYIQKVSWRLPNYLCLTRMCSKCLGCIYYYWNWLRYILQYTWFSCESPAEEVKENQEQPASEQEDKLTKYLSALEDSFASLFLASKLFWWFLKTAIISTKKYIFFVVLYIFKAVLTSNALCEATSKRG